MFSSTRWGKSRGTFSSQPPNANHFQKSPPQQYSAFFKYINAKIENDPNNLHSIDNCLAMGELWENMSNESKTWYKSSAFIPDTFQTKYLTETEHSFNDVEITYLDELLQKDAFLSSNENQQEILNDEEEFDDTESTKLKLNDKQHSNSHIESIFQYSIQVQNPFIKKEQVNNAAHQMQQKLEAWTQILQKYQKQ